MESDAADVPLGSEPIRIRVETSQGVFLVFDAANSPYEPRRLPGFAAYWSDKREEELYLYDRLLYDFVDVGHALANLERDLGVDIEIIYASDEWLAEAFRVAWDQREDSTGWFRPGQTGIALLMGYHPTTDGSDVSDASGSRGVGIEDDEYRRLCLVRLPLTDGGQPVVTYPPPLPRGSDVDDLIEYLIEQYYLCGVCVGPDGTQSSCCTCSCCRGSSCCSYNCCYHFCCEGPCCGDLPCCPPGYKCCDGEELCCRVQDECCGGMRCCTPGKPCCGSTCCPVGTTCTLDDGNLCTDDSCEEITGCCWHLPTSDPTACDDGVFCNGAEMCVGKTCQSGNPPCPAALCNESTDTCDDCTSSTECDDGAFCNGLEACSGGDCVPGADPCPGQQCDEAPDRCVDCLDSGECDDGFFCDGTESCVNGACVAGNPPCPAGLCDETTDTCNDCTQASDCDDGQFCNGAEACDAGNCVSGAEPCPDGPCNEVANSCDACTTASECDDALFCTGVESCDAGSCVSGPDPCPGQLCDESLGRCVDCLGSGPCDDDNPCTVQDKCENGSCVGRVKDCADGDLCTIDECSAVTGACSNTPHTGSCDDGDPCTVGDLCVSGICQGSPDSQCNCPYNYQVSSAGSPAGQPRTFAGQLPIAQGTSYVRVRVSYTSSEWPSFTGESSIFDDELSYQISSPGGLIGQGSTTVNALHARFESGGGVAHELDKIEDYRSHSAGGPSWIDVTGSATNIADGRMPSAVTFRIECEPVDLEYEGLPMTEEYSTGGFVFLNDNDNNQNGVPDLQEPGTDIDLGVLRLTAPEDVEGMVTLRAVSGGTRIKMWESSDRSGAPLVLPETWDVADMPAVLLVEGVAVSNNAADVELKLEFSGEIGTAEDRVKLTVFTVVPKRVDATFPEVSRVDYHLDPHDFTLDRGAFTAPGTDVFDSDLPTDFEFYFDQRELATGESVIRLTATQGGADHVVDIEADRAATKAPPFNLEWETAFCEIPLDAGGVPFIATVPVDHEIMVSFQFICYSTSTVPGSRTLWVGSSLVNIKTPAVMPGIPTDIGAWLELHWFEDTNGTHLEQLMNDPTGPTIPAQGPHFRSKHLDVSEFFAPNENLTAIGKIDALWIDDGTGNGFILCTWIPGVANREIDLQLEPNADPPVDCP